MSKRFRVLLWSAIAFQLLTAGIHSLSFVVSRPPSNDTERLLEELMNTYHVNAGAGFHPTMQDLLTGLSSCFSFMYLLGGVMNIILLRQKAPANVVRPMLWSQSAIFGACFCVMAIFTFLPPVTLTGITFLLLVASAYTAPTTDGMT